MRRGRRPALLAIAAFLVAHPAVAGAASTPARMIEELRAHGIRDARVLDAFRRVRREAFVPFDDRDRAYDDTALPIGHGQTVSQPYVVALMTELLGLTGGERVLEIGTGSGYQAAILAVLAHDVFSIEIIPELATSARLRLTREGYRNVHVKLGDGALGWREYGPYDAIVVTAAAPAVPRPLIEQLKEGGVLVMPLGAEGRRQVLVRGVKRAGKLRTREITAVRFVPMTGERVRPRGLGGEGAPARDRGLREEPLRGPDEKGGPESDTRPLPGVRSRVARAPAARACDRRCANGAGARAGVGSPGEARPVAG